MAFTGLGSMLAPQFREGPFDRPMPPTEEEDAPRELFFFDMLEANLYLARRGMVALSLPVGAAELDRFVAAVTDFVWLRRPLLRAVRAAS